MVRGGWKQERERRPSGAERAAEKGLRGKNQGSERLQGLKPNIDSIGFIGPAEAVPLLQSILKLPPP